MKQPVGVILSAITLGLAALLLLLSAAGMAFAGLFAGRQQPVPPIPHFAIFLIFGLSVFYAVLAVWAIMTIIGILRLNTWARYSILVIGGGLACLGLFLALGTAFSRTMFYSMPTQGPSLNPHILGLIFTLLIAIYVLIAAVGVWWLVYYNLRPIRQLFLNSSEAVFDSANITTRSPRRPTAITILACFFLLSAVCCGLAALLPFPAFLLGIILPAKAAHVLYLVIAVIVALIGYGLLKLNEPARLAAIAFLILGCCNIILSLFPWYQNRLSLYMAQFTATLAIATGQAPALFPLQRIMVISGGILSALVYGLLFWLLHRDRAVFRRPTPASPPPSPLV